MAKTRPTRNMQPAPRTTQHTTGSGKFSKKRITQPRNTNTGADNQRVVGIKSHVVSGGAYFFDIKRKHKRYTTEPLRNLSKKTIERFVVPYLIKKHCHDICFERGSAVFGDDTPGLTVAETDHYEECMRNSVASGKPSYQTDNKEEDTLFVVRMHDLLESSFGRQLLNANPKKLNSIGRDEFKGVQLKLTVELSESGCCLSSIQVASIPRTPQVTEELEYRIKRIVRLFLSFTLRMGEDMNYAECGLIRVFLLTKAFKCRSVRLVNTSCSRIHISRKAFDRMRSIRALTETLEVDKFDFFSLMALLLTMKSDAIVIETIRTDLTENCLLSPWKSLADNALSREWMLPYIRPSYLPGTAEDRIWSCNTLKMKSDTKSCTRLSIFSTFRPSGENAVVELGGHTVKIADLLTMLLGLEEIDCTFKLDMIVEMSCETQQFEVFAETLKEQLMWKTELEARPIHSEPYKMGLKLSIYNSKIKEVNSEINVPAHLSSRIRRLPVEEYLDPNGNIQSRFNLLNGITKAELEHMVDADLLPKLKEPQDFHHLHGHRYYLQVAIDEQGVSHVEFYVRVTNAEKYSWASHGFSNTFNKLASLIYDFMGNTRLPIEHDLDSNVLESAILKIGLLSRVTEFEEIKLTTDCGDSVQLPIREEAFRLLHSLLDRHGSGSNKWALSNFSSITIQSIALLTNGKGVEVERMHPDDDTVQASFMHEVLRSIDTGTCSYTWNPVHFHVNETDDEFVDVTISQFELIRLFEPTYANTNIILDACTVSLKDLKHLVDKASRGFANLFFKSFVKKVVGLEPQFHVGFIVNVCAEFIKINYDTDMYQIQLRLRERERVSSPTPSE